MAIRRSNRTPPVKGHAPYIYKDFQQALDALEAGIREPGYALLVGSSGTGKTTLLRTLGQRLDRSRHQLLYICQGQLTPSSVARLTAEALHLPVPHSRAAIARMLTQHLRAASTHLLIWLDEAQRVGEDTLEELRLLSESDLDGPPLFSIVLAGLPSLRKRLLAPSLFPLLRRVRVKAELKGLRKEELEPYLQHMGLLSRPRSFSAEALDAIFEQGRGIPALIASLAQQCLRIHGKETVTMEIVGQMVERMDWSY